MKLNKKRESPFIKTKGGEKMGGKPIFLIENENHTVLFMPLNGLIIEVKVDEKQKVRELTSRPDFSFNL